MISMVSYGVYIYIYIYIYIWCILQYLFKSQIDMLSYNINHIIVNREVFLLGGWEIEKQVFNIYFLN